ncbi:glucosamine-6-phosphate deaminase [Uliginosibacterium gangwonense]|uniref:glucosamine-6-phosphate deaminase n=1 Tax=Uliginosibacterium gangwonense TaxID=392736 RepID=UPI000361E01F|nr:glucosamine-6-phosphate deaminase [Uliginosibacterium gangwonense]
MEIIIQPTEADSVDIAARIIARLLREKPNAVLGLATGSTPLRLYRALIAMNLDWSQVTSFNLDEYVGLDPNSPMSYHSFMWANLFDHINIRKDKVNIPDGTAKDIPAFCAEYEEKIKSAGGIDLQVLGIGTEGHIGFNEPTSSLGSRTRIKTLTPQTRRDNARFFDGEDKVPTHVITMGIGTIMEARENLLLAFGANKAHAIAQAVEGPISSINPASILQMHPQAKVCVDAEAASQLTRSEYYKWVYANKPAWQRL